MSKPLSETQQAFPKKREVAVAVVLDTDPEVARVMVTTLARRSIRAHMVSDARAVLNALDRGPCDIVFATISALQGPGRGGACELIRQFKLTHPELPVVLMAGSQEMQAESGGHCLLRVGVDVVKQAADWGCSDVLIKPLMSEQVDEVIDRFLPNRKVCQVTQVQGKQQRGFSLVGRSAAMHQTVSLVDRIAPTSAPVMVMGESGTGKELIAYLIHQRSQRSHRPYVRVNCAALSDTLLESELFGHEKGAFTGAINCRKGRFEMAHGGTLLLDEITETPPSFQAKLLRILEQQEFERVGGNKNIQVNVRIISTTNRNMAELVQQGRFRADLYYRLCATRLVLPPLRQRKEDLVELVWYFINEYVHESQRNITALDPGMMQLFANYDWPGNIRQLRNVVRSSLILGHGTILSLVDAAWLFDGIECPGRSEVSMGTLEQDDDDDLVTDLGGMPLEVVERRAILDTLRQTDGNRKKAAEVLGISDRTLRERIRRYKQDDCLLSI